MSSDLTLDRQRKTKNPCLECYLHKEICMCDLIPTIEIKTRIALVVHAKELKRPTNTGRLAIKALSNSVMRIRGLDKKTLDLSDLLNNNYRSLVFYPCEGSVELTKELANESDKPIQLIVPDGNWRQASKVHHRHKELAALPRVMISTPNTNKFFMRKENTPEGMATLQAIAHALKIIEGDAVYEALINVYNEKLKRTLQARGLWKE
ncbi:MAG: tRNA-uridine aminocarboxypropyltransferase [Bdellovibrionota bacterium]